jgi:hypothetical protein
VSYDTVIRREVPDNEGRADCPADKNEGLDRDLHGLYTEQHEFADQQATAVKERSSVKTKRGGVGSSFDDFLKEEGIYEEVMARAIKRVVARQRDALVRSNRGVSEPSS